MKFMLFLTLLASFFSAQAEVVFITDVDDTIKQTNVLHKWGMTSRYIKGYKPFQYMAEVMTELKFIYESAGETFSINYLSASPSCMIDQAKWNEAYHFPVGNIIQKTCRLSGDDSFRSETKEYKLAAIRKLLKEKEEISKLILFGDNAEWDPDIYLTIAKENPGITTEIYIRDIRAAATYFNSELSVNEKFGVNYFLTEIDLFKSLSLSKNLFINLTLSLKNQTLLADFIKNNLANRIKEELKINRRKALNMAEEILNSHY